LVRPDLSPLPSPAWPALTTAERVARKPDEQNFHALPRAPISVVLDDVRSLANVGLIFRICDALESATPVSGTEVHVDSTGFTIHIPFNIDVRPDGRGLPAGSGTADQGQPIFAQKCATCHGANGEGSSVAPKLVDPTPFMTGVNAPTIGNYWPYATTVWDYIDRAMPFDMPGSLAPDEVYALTAYLLSENQIIAANEVIAARSLPKVNMPNAAGFASPDPRPDAP
jgi:S-disulfanyl-L-cysteine oxidoreductase SoxD